MRREVVAGTVVEIGPGDAYVIEPGQEGGCLRVSCGRTRLGRCRLELEPDERLVPHWGYVLKGRLVVRYEDREETIEAGDAFYMPPGHAPEAEEGTEIVQFSPAEELAAMVAALKGSMQPEEGQPS